MEKSKTITVQSSHLALPISIFSLFTFLFIMPVSAQQMELTTKIYNPDSTVVYEGTVSLLTKDSTVVGSTYWIDGQAKINLDIKETPIVRFSSIGFTPFHLDMSNRSATLSKEQVNIIMKSAMKLEEVVVTGQRNTINQNGNKLVFQVSKSSFSVGGTADELIKKTPMVFVGSDGTTSIVGKGPATVLLDGIPISREMLASIPSSNIEKIEVISNPGAAYDASGAGVINIVSKKNHSQSSYAVIDGSITKGRKLRESVGAQAGVKLNRWKFDGKYRYYPSRLQYEDNFNRTIGRAGGSELFQMDQHVEKNKNIPNRHSFSLGAGVRLNEHLQLHADGNYNHMQGTNIDKGLNAGLLDGEPNFLLNNITQGNVKNQSGILNYGLTWGSSNKKHRLNIDGNSTWYRYSKFDLIGESLSDTDGISESTKKNQNSNNIDLQMFRADYSWELAKNSSLDFGIKNMHSSNRSRLLFSTLKDGAWNTEENEYNSYKYDEDIFSAYTSFKKQLVKLKIEAGFRMEMTDASGTSQTTGRKLIDSSYLNLFPSLALNYALDENWDISANYQKRITRPQYQVLNPYRLYIDSLSVYSGNPLLKPEQTDFLEGAILFKKLASLKVNYARTKNAVQTVVRQLDESSLVSMATYTNLDRTEALNVTLSLPYQVGRFTTFNIISYTKNFVNANVDGLTFDLKKPFWFFYSYNELKLPGSWSLELTGTYNTSGLMGIFAFRPKLNISASIKKELIQNKLTVHLSANDIFNRDIVRTSTSFNNFDLRYRGFEDNRYLRLSISYNLGNLKNLTKSKTMDSRIKAEQ